MNIVIRHSAIVIILACLFVCCGQKGDGSTAELKDESVYPGLPSTLEPCHDGTWHTVEMPAILKSYLVLIKQDNPFSIEKYAEEFPRSPFADDALLEAGRIFSRKGHRDHALEALRKCWDEYPAAIALDPIYQQFQGRGKIYPSETKRYQVYREHIQKFPNRTSDIAMIEIGMIYIGTGEIKKAKSAFRQVVTRYPKGQYCIEDKEACITMFYDPNRPLAQALWHLAELHRSERNTIELERTLQRIVEYYPASFLGLTCLTSLAEQKLKENDNNSVQELLSRKLDIVRQMMEVAKKNSFSE